MNKHRDRQLRKELRAAGAAEAEVAQLLPLAGSLRLLKDAPAEVPVRRAAGRRRPKILRPAAYTAAGLAAGMLLMAVSQSVLPTSMFYPVQKLSDSVAVSVHPQYRAAIMMKRAQQVNQLVAVHAAPGKVLATLADYTRIADAYKTVPHANYAAFEYCEANLNQAARTAPPQVRAAIAASLRSLGAA